MTSSSTAKQRIVYLVESPFSERDARRFGVSELRHLGFDVTAWELAPIYLPRSEAQWIQPAVGVASERFTSLEQVRLACRQLGPQDTLITLVGVFRGQMRSRGELLELLAQTPARLATISAGHMPQAPVPSASVMTRIRGAVARRRDALIAKRRVRTITRQRRRTIGSASARLLDFVWVGTTTVDIEPGLIGPDTKVHFIHTFDYELLRNVVVTPLDEAHLVTVVDSMGPLHPDLHTNGTDEYSISADEYFRRMRSLLRHLAVTSDQRVQVAAHPRAQPGSMDAHYAGFQVLYGQTIPCIAESSLVVLTYPSTTVGLAVALGRPACLITSASLPTIAQPFNELLQSTLHLPTIDLDATEWEWVFPEVNAAAYARYLAKYVKGPSSQDFSFWEAVSQSIRGQQPVQAQAQAQH